MNSLLFLSPTSRYKPNIWLIIGVRGISALTPSQLARKRANDREAQRAIRARTKEHIRHLQSEIENLRSAQSRDETVQKLLCDNKALEDELRQLKESMGLSMGLSMTSSLHSAPTPTTCSHLVCPINDTEASLAPQLQRLLAMCPLAYNEDNCRFSPSPSRYPLPPRRGGYIYGQVTKQRVPMPNCEIWASILPSSVPSPSSSVNIHKYGPATGLIPASTAGSTMGTTGTSLVDSKELMMEFKCMNDMIAVQSYVQQTEEGCSESSS